MERVVALGDGRSLPSDEASSMEADMVAEKLGEKLGQNLALETLRALPEMPNEHLEDYKLQQYEYAMHLDSAMLVYMPAPGKLRQQEEQYSRFDDSKTGKRKIFVNKEVLGRLVDVAEELNKAQAQIEIRKVLKRENKRVGVDGQLLAPGQGELDPTAMDDILHGMEVQDSAADNFGGMMVDPAEMAAARGAGRGAAAAAAAKRALKRIPTAVRAAQVRYPAILARKAPRDRWGFFRAMARLIPSANTARPGHIAFGHGGGSNGPVKQTREQREADRAAEAAAVASATAEVLAAAAAGAEDSGQMDADDGKAAAAEMNMNATLAAALRVNDMRKARREAAQQEAEIEGLPTETWYDIMQRRKKAVYFKRLLSEMAERMGLVKLHCAARTIQRAWRRHRRVARRKATVRVADEIEALKRELAQRRAMELMLRSAAEAALKEQQEKERAKMAKKGTLVSRSRRTLTDSPDPKGNFSRANSRGLNWMTSLRGGDAFSRSASRAASMRRRGMPQDEPEEEEEDDGEQTSGTNAHSDKTYGNQMQNLWNKIQELIGDDWDLEDEEEAENDEAEAEAAEPLETPEEEGGDEDEHLARLRRRAARNRLRRERAVADAGTGEGGKQRRRRGGAGATPAQHLAGKLLLSSKANAMAAVVATAVKTAKAIEKIEEKAAKRSKKKSPRRHSPNRRSLDGSEDPAAQMRTWQRAAASLGMTLEAYLAMRNRRLGVPTGAPQGTEGGLGAVDDPSAEELARIREEARREVEERIREMTAAAVASVRSMSTESSRVEGAAGQGQVAAAGEGEAAAATDGAQGAAAVAAGPESDPGVAGAAQAGQEDEASGVCAEPGAAPDAAQAAVVAPEAPASMVASTAATPRAEGMPVLAPAPPLLSGPQLAATEREAVEALVREKLQQRRAAREAERAAMEEAERKWAALEKVEEGDEEDGSDSDDDTSSESSDGAPRRRRRKAKAKAKAKKQAAPASAVDAGAAAQPKPKLRAKKPARRSSSSGSGYETMSEDEIRAADEPIQARMRRQKARAGGDLGAYYNRRRRARALAAAAAEAALRAEHAARDEGRRRRKAALAALAAAAPRAWNQGAAGAGAAPPQWARPVVPRAVAAEAVEAARASIRAVKAVPRERRDAPYQFSPGGPSLLYRQAHGVRRPAASAAAPWQKGNPMPGAVFSLFGWMPAPEGAGGDSQGGNTGSGGGGSDPLAVQAAPLRGRDALLPALEAYCRQAGFGGPSAFSVQAAQPHGAWPGSAADAAGGGPGYGRSPVPGLLIGHLATPAQHANPSPRGPQHMVLTPHGLQPAWHGAGALPYADSDSGSAPAVGDAAAGPHAATPMRGAGMVGHAMTGPGGAPNAHYHPHDPSGGGYSPAAAQHPPHQPLPPGAAVAMAARAGPAAAAGRDVTPDALLERLQASRQGERPQGQGAAPGRQAWAMQLEGQELADYWQQAEQGTQGFAGAAVGRHMQGHASALAGVAAVGLAHGPAAAGAHGPAGQAGGRGRGAEGRGAAGLGAPADGAAEADGVAWVQGGAEGPDGHDAGSGSKRVGASPHGPAEASPGSAVADQRVISPRPPSEQSGAPSPRGSMGRRAAPAAHMASGQNSASAEAYDSPGQHGSGVTPNAAGWHGGVSGEAPGPHVAVDGGSAPRSGHAVPLPGAPGGMPLPAGRQGSAGIAHMGAGGSNAASVSSLTAQHSAQPQVHQHLRQPSLHYQRQYQQQYPQQQASAAEVVMDDGMASGWLSPPSQKVRGAGAGWEEAPPPPPPAAAADPAAQGSALKVALAVLGSGSIHPAIARRLYPLGRARVADPAARLRAAMEAPAGHPGPGANPAGGVGAGPWSFPLPDLAEGSSSSDEDSGWATASDAEGQGASHRSALTSPAATGRSGGPAALPSPLNPKLQVLGQQQGPPALVSAARVQAAAYGSAVALAPPGAAAAVSGRSAVSGVAGTAVGPAARAGAPSRHPAASQGPGTARAAGGPDAEGPRPQPGQQEAGMEARAAAEADACAWPLDDPDAERQFDLLYDMTRWAVAPPPTPRGYEPRLMAVTLRRSETARRRQQARGAADGGGAGSAIAGPASAYAAYGSSLGAAYQRVRFRRAQNRAAAAVIAASSPVRAVLMRAARSFRAGVAGRGMDVGATHGPAAAAATPRTSVSAAGGFRRPHRGAGGHGRFGGGLAWQPGAGEVLSFGAVHGVAAALRVRPRWANTGSVVGSSYYWRRPVRLASLMVVRPVGRPAAATAPPGAGAVPACARGAAPEQEEDMDEEEHALQQPGAVAEMASTAIHLLSELGSEIAAMEQRIAFLQHCAAKEQLQGQGQQGCGQDGRGGGQGQGGGHPAQRAQQQARGRVAQALARPPSQQLSPPTGIKGVAVRRSPHPPPPAHYAYQPQHPPAPAPAPASVLRTGILGQAAATQRRPSPPSRGSGERAAASRSAPCSQQPHPPQQPARTPPHASRAQRWDSSGSGPASRSGAGALELLPSPGAAGRSGSGGSPGPGPPRGPPQHQPSAAAAGPVLAAWLHAEPDLALDLRVTSRPAPRTPAAAAGRASPPAPAEEHSGRLPALLAAATSPRPSGNGTPPSALHAQPSQPAFPLGGSPGLTGLGLRPESSAGSLHGGRAWQGQSPPGLPDIAPGASLLRASFSQVPGAALRALHTPPAASPPVSPHTQRPGAGGLASYPRMDLGTAAAQLAGGGPGPRTRRRGSVDCAPGPGYGQGHGGGAMLYSMSALGGVAGEGYDSAPLCLLGGGGAGRVSVDSLLLNMHLGGGGGPLSPGGADRQHYMAAAQRAGAAEGRRPRASEADARVSTGGGGSASGGSGAGGVRYARARRASLGMGLGAGPAAGGALLPVLSQPSL